MNLVVFGEPRTMARTATAPMAASTTRSTSPCAASSAPVSIPAAELAAATAAASHAKPSESELYEMEERSWIMFERLSAAGLRVLDPEEALQLEQMIVLRKRNGGARLCRSNPDVVRRGAAVPGAASIPIARESFSLLINSPTDVTAPQSFGDQTDLLKERRSDLEAELNDDGGVATDPLFDVDL